MKGAPQVIFRISVINRSLVLIILVLCMSHILSHLIFDFVGNNKYTEQLVEWFGLDGEGNFPALFSFLLLIIASFQFLMIATICKSSSEDESSNHRYWVGLFLIFLFLAFDEAVQIHEKFDRQALLSFMNTSGLLAWPWVIVYGMIVLVFVVIYFRFWYSLPYLYRIMYFVAALIYVGAALGLEMIGAAEYTEGGGRASLLYFAIYTIEELMEMAAITLLIYANNLLLANNYSPLIFELSTTVPGPVTEQSADE